MKYVSNGMGSPKLIGGRYSSYLFEWSLSEEIRGLVSKKGYGSVRLGERQLCLSA